jgi:hypothetical protein
VFRRGKTYYVTLPTGQRKSLKTRDLREAVARAAKLRGEVPILPGGVGASSTPGSDAPVGANVAPPLEPPAVVADPVAEVGGSDEDDDEVEVVDGEVVDRPPITSDGLSDGDKLIARDLAHTMAALTCLCTALGLRYAGVQKAHEPSAPRVEALVSAWEHKTREWVRDEKFSAWTLIIAATVGVGVEQAMGTPGAA